MRLIEKKGTVKDTTGEDWWVWVLGPDDRSDRSQRRVVQFYPLAGWPDEDEVTFDRDAVIAALGLVETNKPPGPGTKPKVIGGISTPPHASSPR